MSEINKLPRSGEPEQSAEARNSPAEESFADFARRLGVARSTVTRAAQAGRLVLVGRPGGGKAVRVLESLQRLEATRGLRDDVAERHAAQRGQPLPAASGVGVVGVAEVSATAATGPNRGDAGAGQGAGPAEAANAGLRAVHQRRALSASNSLLQVTLELQRGDRFPRDAVLAEAQGLGTSLRAGVERLIDQTAPRLAAAAAGGGAEAQAAQRRILREELRVLRAALARDFRVARRRLRPQAAAAGGAAMAGALAQAAQVQQAGEGAA